MINTNLSSSSKSMKRILQKIESLWHHFYFGEVGSLHHLQSKSERYINLGIQPLLQKLNTNICPDGTLTLNFNDKINRKYLDTNKAWKMLANLLNYEKCIRF